MRYVVIGCGAIGGTVAAGLARDGHEVLVCDADPAVVAAISERGLRIEGPVENFTAEVPAVTPDDLPAELDGPVLVAVKAQHTAAAAELLAGRLTDRAFVVSIQNGLNAPTLAAAVGPGKVVEALVNFGADVTGPGVVLRGNRATFLIGEPDGTVSERVRALAADIADAEVTENVLGYLWAKEAYGAMLTATAVSDLAIADVLEDPAYAPLLLGLAREVLDQAPVTPMAFDGFDPDDLEGSLGRLVAFNRGSAKSHSGIYRDLAVRHRPTEVPAILGGMEGTLIRRTCELITAIEQGKRVCTRANLDLLAAYERLERLGRPLNSVTAVIGAPERAATGPLAGRPVAVKDIVAVAGVPTRCGSPASSPEPAAQGRGDRAPAAGRRGRGVRGHPVPGVRGRLRPPGDRRHPQPARPVPHLGRVVGRVGGPGRRRRVRPGHRLGHRRVDPDPGRLLRDRGAQADLRAAAAGRGVPAVAELRPRGHADRDRGRRRGPDSGAAPACPRSRSGSRARSRSACWPRSSPTRR